MITYIKVWDVQEGLWLCFHEFLEYFMHPKEAKVSNVRTRVSVGLGGTCGATSDRGELWMAISFDPSIGFRHPTHCWKALEAHSPLVLMS